MLLAQPMSKGIAQHDIVFDDQNPSHDWVALSSPWLCSKQFEQPPIKTYTLAGLKSSANQRFSGVVQIRVTLEARKPLAGAALARSSVTRKQHFLNHARTRSAAHGALT